MFEHHVVKFYYQNQCSIRVTIPAIREFYPRYNPPAKSSIKHLVTKFEATVSTNNYRNKSISKNPLIFGRSQDLDLSAISVWRFLGRDLDLHL